MHRASEKVMTKSDLQLKHDVEQELLWDPKINAAQIGVTVDAGTVSLFGAVGTYGEKLESATAAKRVSGVRCVADDVSVKILGDHVRTDSELAAAIQRALEWNVMVPKSVTIKVQDGWITLEGVVDGNYQREAAERAMLYLTGVLGVTNSIELRAEGSSTEVKSRIESALKRHAVADAKAIEVSFSGGKVTLTGSVTSWSAIQDARDAAWAAPGVTEVEDRLKMW
jgi:osmotically-inducible protein OsmY